jgi:tetratricopeptide (TPR) repeat protein
VILILFFKTQNVRRDACDCLKWKYKGNSHLEGGKVSLAIDAYNKALANCIDDNSKQEGIILLLRASTYLQQARSHKQILQTAVQEWTLPNSRDLQGLMLEASAGGPERSGLANSILKKLQTDARRQQSELRKIQYRHGLYQYSLLHAAQDSLRATELLPDYATSWLRAGELLSELWKLKESRQYYEKALSLDESLEASLEPILQGLERRRELRERARATREWPEDSLRLALDVAG